MGCSDVELIRIQQAIGVAVDFGACPFFRYRYQQTVVELWVPAAERETGQKAGVASRGEQL